MPHKMWASKFRPESLLTTRTRCVLTAALRIGLYSTVHGYNGYRLPLFIKMDMQMLLMCFCHLSQTGNSTVRSALQSGDILRLAPIHRNATRFLWLAAESTPMFHPISRAYPASLTDIPAQILDSNCQVFWCEALRRSKLHQIPRFGILQ